MDHRKLSLPGKEAIDCPGVLSRLHPQLQLHQGTWRNDAPSPPQGVHLHFLNCYSEIVTILSCGVLGYEVSRFTGKCEPKPGQALFRGLGVGMTVGPSNTTIPEVSLPPPAHQLGQLSLLDLVSSLLSPEPICVCLCVERPESFLTMLPGST